MLSLGDYYLVHCTDIAYEVATSTFYVLCFLPFFSRNIQYTTIRVHMICCEVKYLCTFRIKINDKLEL